MSSLATALKKEIQRLAKKEAVAVVKDVKVAMKEERAQVKTLQGTIKDQAKEIASLRKALEGAAMAAPVVTAAPVKAGKGKKKAAKTSVAKTPVKGWRKDSVRTTRRIHNLSQNAFAKLVGVGLNTVWLWENGRTNPRPKQQEAVLELRGLSEQQLSNRLSGLGLSSGKKKPGRKKMTPAKAETTRKKVSPKKTAKKAAKKTSGRKKAVKK